MPISVNYKLILVEVWSDTSKAIKAMKQEILFAAKEVALFACDQFLSIFVEIRDKFEKKKVIVT